MDGRTQSYAEAQTEGEALLYDIRYSRLYDSKGPIITRGTMIGGWSFHRMNIAGMTGLSASSLL